MMQTVSFEPLTLYDIGALMDKAQKGARKYLLEERDIVESIKIMEKVSMVADIVMFQAIGAYVVNNFKTPVVTTQFLSVKETRSVSIYPFRYTATISRIKAIPTMNGIGSRYRVSFYKIKAEIPKVPGYFDPAKDPGGYWYIKSREFC